MGLALLAGCAIRIGGPDAVEYRVLSIKAAADAPAERVASQIRDADAQIVLLEAERDTAWFAEVARGAELELSGPGLANGHGLAFLAPTPVGDTTIAIPVTPTGDSVTVHDALYRVDDNRYLDVLATRVPAGVDRRKAIRALLDYIATDVPSNAGVIIAVDAADAAGSESVADLFRPAFANASECLLETESDGPDDVDEAPPPDVPLPVYYGPQLRMLCEDAELRAGAIRALLANLVVRP